MVQKFNSIIFYCSFVGLLVPSHSNTQDDGNIETNAARSDHLVNVQSSENMSDKENASAHETDQCCSSPDRDKLVSLILTADDHLRFRPIHVRKLSNSFKNISTLPNIKE